MTRPSSKRSILAVMILLPYVILFVIGYFNSANRGKMPYRESENKFYSQSPLHQDQHQSNASVNYAPKDQVYLQKNQKITINKTNLVYKGISKGIVKMELYVLELDPDVPYRLRFSKKSLKQGVKIGYGQYSLVSARRNSLRLKIENLF